MRGTATLASPTDTATEVARHRLRLLGGFDLLEDQRSVALPRGVQRLVAFLAVQHGPTRRARIAAELWPDVPEARAHANLRTALWRLGRLARPVVEVHGPDLLLVGAVSVDARHTVAQAHALLTATADLPVDVAADVFSQVLLPGWYDEWVLVEREQLRQLCLHSLEVLARALTTRGQFGRAVEAAMIAVQDDPLRESAQRALILAYLGEGNRCDAIRVYGEYVVVLDQQLGLAPSPDLQRLVRGPSTA